MIFSARTLVFLVGSYTRLPFELSFLTTKYPNLQLILIDISLSPSQRHSLCVHFPGIKSIHTLTLRGKLTQLVLLPLTLLISIFLYLDLSKSFWHCSPPALRKFLSPLEDLSCLNFSYDNLPFLPRLKKANLSSYEAVLALLYACLITSTSLARRLLKLNTVFLTGCKVYHIRLLALLLPFIAKYSSANSRISLWRTSPQLEPVDYDPSICLTSSYQYHSSRDSYLEPETFFQQRTLGRLTSNPDLDVSPGIAAQESPYSDQTNILFLHVFHDSPFHTHDNQRLFFSYRDWVFHTLKVLSNSQQTWFIKLHPSAPKWGEDSLLILNSIITKSIGSLPQNIHIDNSPASPDKRFLAHADKIVTFSGTVAIEALALGRKPIVICRNSFFNASDSPFFIPKTLPEYTKYLLNTYSNTVTDDALRQKAIYALYCSEYLYTASSCMSPFRWRSTQTPANMNNDFLLNLQNSEQFPLFHL